LIHLTYNQLSKVLFISLGEKDIKCVCVWGGWWFHSPFKTWVQTLAFDNNSFWHCNQESNIVENRPAVKGSELKLNIYPQSHRCKLAAVSLPSKILRRNHSCVNMSQVRSTQV